MKKTKFRSGMVLEKTDKWDKFSGRQELDKENSLRFITNFNIGSLEAYKVAIGDSKDYEICEMVGVNEESKSYGKSVHYVGDLKNRNTKVADFWEHLDKVSHYNSQTGYREVK